MIIINEKDRGDTIIENLNVTRNGIYQEANKAYSPVIVEVPEMVLNELSVTENGEYTPSQGTDGFSKVNVNVALPENVYLLKTVKDDVVSFDDGSILPMPSVIADINAVQDLHGYDSPWVGGSGKNKFDISKMAELEGVTVSGDTFTGLARSFYNSGNILATFNVPAGTTLNVSCTAKSDGVETSGAGFALLFVYSDNTTLRPWYTSNSETSFTNHSGAVTAGKDIVGYKFVDYNSGVKNTWTVKNFQIELGSTATSYAPYSNICPISGFNGGNVHVSPTTNAQDGTTYSVSWESEAGTVYGGNVDLVSGVLTVTMVMMKLSEINSFSSGDINTYGYIRYNCIVEAKASTYNIICDKIKVINERVSTNASSELISGYDSNNRLYFTINSTRLTGDLSTQTTRNNALKSLLTNDDITVVYELATPLTYQLTPTQVSSLLGINNVWNDTNGETEVKYFGK